MKTNSEINEILSNNRSYKSSKAIRTITKEEVEKKYSRFLKSSISEVYREYTYFIVWHKKDKYLPNKISSYILYDNFVIAYKTYDFYPIKQLKIEAKRYINYLIKTKIIEDIKR